MLGWGQKCHVEQGQPPFTNEDIMKTGNPTKKI